MKSTSSVASSSSDDESRTVLAMLRSAFLFVLILIVGCAQQSVSDTRQENEVANNFEELEAAGNSAEGQDTGSAALAAIKAEPKVKDVLHDDGLVVQWKVAVLDDGTDRLGYAQYLCQVLREHRPNSPPPRLRVVSWQRVLQDRMFDDDANLATVDCATGERFGDARE